MTGVDENVLATTLFASVAVLVGVDLLSDAGSGVAWSHVGLEGVAAAVAVLGASWFLRRHRQEVQAAASWKARAEELLKGLGLVVDEQLDAWLLTGAEREVAVLLLKGLSFKEIASVRDTSERTAREQARGVYRKAGVAGRAELSAWFFEDLVVAEQGHQVR